MQSIIELLKSKGKLGGAGLMALGAFQLFFSYFKGVGEYQSGAATFFLGLGLLGIRSKQD